MEGSPETSTELVVAIATSAAAAIAGIAALVAALAHRVVAHSVDVSQYLDIHARFQRAEEKLYDTSNSDEKRKFLLHQHFNFMEAVADLYNKGKLSPRTSELCRDILINHFVAVAIDLGNLKTFVDSVTSPDAYSELARFWAKNQDSIAVRYGAITVGQSE